MRRGFETLSVAYVVVAGLYGGAMYFASHKHVVEDLTHAPIYAYEAAQEQFPEAEEWIADAAARFHNQFATTLAQPFGVSPLSGGRCGSDGC